MTVSPTLFADFEQVFTSLGFDCCLKVIFGFKQVGAGLGKTCDRVEYYG